MGLAISVGVLANGAQQDPEWIDWLKRKLEEVNRVLAKNKLPAHIEPAELSKLPYRKHLKSFPYSWLHYLRRATAYARQSPEQFCPVADGEEPSMDDKIDRELTLYMDSHLICHSDCEGFYVPIDFSNPLYDDADGKLPGGILGSSQRALQEVIKTAPLLGIVLIDGNLSDEAAALLAKEDDGTNPYWIERKVWLSMYETLRLSVEYKSAVVFH